MWTYLYNVDILYMYWVKQGTENQPCKFISFKISTNNSEKKIQQPSNQFVVDIYVYCQWLNLGMFQDIELVEIASRLIFSTWK